MPRAAFSEVARSLSLAGVLLVAHTGVLAAAVLRETHEFWLNSGGYPVELREAVQLLFYPALLALLLSQIGLLAWVLRCRRRSPLDWAILGFTSLSLSLVVVVTVSNNLLNLWQGRPLHWHPV